MEVYKNSFIGAIPDHGTYDVWPQSSSALLPKSRIKRFLGRYIFYPLRVFIATRIKRYDIVHLLDHSSLHLLPYVSKNIKTVVTLHDLIPLRFGGGLSSDQVARFRSTVANLTKVDHIVSVSEYSKKEAVAFFDLSEDMIEVIANGVTAQTASRDIESIIKFKEAGAVVLLSVGSTLERKNLKVLPEMFKKVKGNRPLALLRVGASLPDELRNQIIEVLGEDNLIELGKVDAQTVWNAYHGTDIVLVPSLYEGFGLPIIEALSAGKLVVSSNSSSLAEVAGDFAHYFDPKSASDGATALEKAIDLLPLSEDQESARRNYAYEFSWAKHVQKCQKVYEEILQS